MTRLAFLLFVLLVFPAALHAAEGSRPRRRIDREEMKRVYDTLLMSNVQRSWTGQNEHDDERRPGKTIKSTTQLQPDVKRLLTIVLPNDDSFVVGEPKLIAKIDVEDVKQTMSEQQQQLHNQQVRPTRSTPPPEQNTILRSVSVSPVSETSSDNEDWSEEVTIKHKQTLPVSPQKAMTQIVKPNITRQDHHIRRGRTHSSVRDSTPFPGRPRSSRASQSRSRESINALRRERRRSREGRVRLVGGRSPFEGNVEVYHNGEWGAICDDEWDLMDANVVCKQLNFVLGARKVTFGSRYGKTRRKIWMSNVLCTGNETKLTECRFDGWNNHDCSRNEGAGVVCRTSILDPGFTFRVKDNAPKEETLTLKRMFGEEVAVRLLGDVVDHRGRIEVRVKGEWNLVCGDGWSMNEAQVVCNQLGLGAAKSALHVEAFDDDVLPSIISGIQCQGTESSLSECLITPPSQWECPDSYDSIAGVNCSPELPDLEPNAAMLEASALVEDRSIMFLQCAMEENCLSQSAYRIDKSDPEWIFATRRLLRFTAAIKNIGRAPFRPFAPKSAWQWHSCHRHYHSMEVFAHFDILDRRGHRVAEGHKASFCLEDNLCEDGARQTFACADFGDQGISVGCVDIYKSDLDCQWIDITDIPAGNYHLKVTINPEFKIPELSFDNNAVLCNFYYNKFAGHVTNCTVTAP